MTADELEQLTVDVYQSADVDRIDEMRSSIASLERDGRARTEAVVGGAWLVCFKLSHEPRELELALAGLEQAFLLEPSDSRASNLAAVLHARYRSCRATDCSWRRPASP